MCRARSDLLECLSEDRNLVAGLGAGEAKIGAAHRPARGTRMRRGGEEHRPCREGRRPGAEEARALRFDPRGQRLLPVDLRLEDRPERTVERLEERCPHLVVAERQQGGGDERCGALPAPERIDRVRHDLEDASGALELLEHRPVAREAPQHLGVERVRPAHLLLAGRLAGLGRKIGTVLPIEPAKRPNGVVARLLACLVQWLEETAADDFEGLDAARGGPGGLHPAKDLLEAPQRIPALLVADLGARFRKRPDHHCALDRRRGLGERLDEGVVLEAAELACEGHHLVHEDEARCRLTQDRDEPLRARVGAGGLGVRNGIDRLPAPEPPREIAPQGSDLAAVLGVHRFGRALVGAHEHRAPDLTERLDPGGLEERPHPVEALRAIARVRRAGEVMKREHGVGLATAEIGLKPDHGLPAPSGETRQRRAEDPPETLRHIGDAEERGRVAVLLAAFPLIDKREIGGELGIGEARLEHVRVGLADLAPGTEPFRGGRLIEGETRRRRGGLAPACRALGLVQPLDDRGLRHGPNGGDKLAHRVAIAERLARPQIAREVRGAVARIERKGDEAPRLPKLRVEPEEIAPLIEKGLEESVDVQLASGLVPTRPARVLAPVGAVAVLHVLGDMGAEPDPKRLQPLFDPLLGRERRCFVLLRAHFTPSMSTSSSLAPKRRKSLVLNVNSRRSPCASMVAAILASWTCLPPTGTSRQRTINAAMTFGPSSRTLNDPSSLSASSSASLMASGSDQL